MKRQKTKAGYALLKLKKWLEKRGCQYAERLLSEALTNFPRPLLNHPEYAMNRLWDKQMIGRTMAECIESYELREFWRGPDGYLLRRYIDGFDASGRRLDQDEEYDAPFKVWHPDGDAEITDVFAIYEEEDPDITDYLFFDRKILLYIDKIHESNAGESRDSMESRFTPNFIELNKLVAEAECKIDDSYRFVMEKIEQVGQ